MSSNSNLDANDGQNVDATNPFLSMANSVENMAINEDTDKIGAGNASVVWPLNTGDGLWSHVADDSSVGRMTLNEAVEITGGIGSGGASVAWPLDAGVVYKRLIDTDDSSSEESLTLNEAAETTGGYGAVGPSVAWPWDAGATNQHSFEGNDSHDELQVNRNANAVNFFDMGYNKGWGHGKVLWPKK